MQKQLTLNENQFVAGMRSGIPIAIGYIPIALAFGLLAKSGGVPNHVAVLLSMLVFAGASQFVAVNMLIAGINPWQIVITTFILNFRHFLMSSSLALRLEPGISRGMLSLLSFGITDETFSVASLSERDKLPLSYVLGLAVTGYGAWNLGTIAGVLVASGLPPLLADSMGIALYAMFIGLLVPAAVKSLPLVMVAVTAMAARSLLRWLPFVDISPGWEIIVCTILGAGVGAIFYPERGDDNE
ncbi:MAG: AzlC family ABC transporter permease [Firmicutes bacterium]|nr:AzlC family ABC transporter permease [Bacillota bacterium]